MAVVYSKVYLFGGGLVMRITVILTVCEIHYYQWLKVIKKAILNVSLLLFQMRLSSLSRPFPYRHH
jgi:hypothetical protein